MNSVLMAKKASGQILRSSELFMILAAVFSVSKDGEITDVAMTSIGNKISIQFKYGLPSSRILALQRAQISALNTMGFTKNARTLKDSIIIYLDPYILDNKCILNLEVPEEWKTILRFPVDSSTNAKLLEENFARSCPPTNG